jgi:HK97 gp10 family phage protein
VSGGISIGGIPELAHIIDALGVRESRNLNRATIHAVAAVTTKAAKAKAPKDSGTLRRALKAKRRRAQNPDKPFSDVMVEHGKDAKNDAWYWRFVEFGTTEQAARPFIQPSIDEVRANIVPIYKEQFFKKLASRIKREQKKTRRG